MQRAKNKKIIAFIAILLTIFMALSLLPILKSVKAKDEKPQSLKIAHISDTHYLAPELVNTKNPDYVKYMKTEQKLFAESGAILDEAFNQMVKDAPDVIVVTGDLTKDGEYESHKKFAKKLETLRAALRAKGRNPKIYVINGNHDINNSLAEDFSGKNSTKKTRKTTPEEFKEIYKNITYNNDVEMYTNETKQGGLSYVARPKEGFTIIAADVCKYTPDATSTKTNEHETAGKVSEDLLKWIEEKTAEAKKRGDIVFVIQHHSIVPHFTMEPTLAKDFLVDNYKEAGIRYAKAGIKHVFTGHVHANDIAQLQNTDYGKDYELNDIETGSMVTYPCPFRFITLTNDIKNQTELAQIETRFIKNIDYKDENGNYITDVKEYASKNNIDEGFLKLMAQDYVDQYLNKIKNHPKGLEGFLNDLIGQSKGMKNFNIKDFVIDTIKSSLPQNENDAVEKQFASTDNSHISAKIFYEPEKNRIRVKGSTTAYNNNLEWFDVSVTDESIKKTLDDIIKTTEEKIIKDPKAINKLIDELIPAILKYEVAPGHTLKEMANIIVQSNQDGTDSNQPQWITDVMNNSDALVDGLLSTIIDKAYPILTDDVLSNYTINAGKIISPSFGKDLNKAIIKEMFALNSRPMTFSERMQKKSLLRKRLFSNINSQSIVGIAQLIGDVNVGKTVKTFVKADKVKSMLPASLKEKLNTFLVNAMYSYGYDTNFINDNNATILNYKTKDEMKLYNDALKEMKGSEKVTKKSDDQINVKEEKENKTKTPDFAKEKTNKETKETAKENSFESMKKAS